MALSLVVLTEQLLDGITDQQLLSFVASIPTADRPFWKARLPTRAQILDYVRGELTDRNAKDGNGDLIVPHPKVAQSLRAVLIRDDGVPYAVVCGRDYPSGATKVHWVGPVDARTLTALGLVRDALVSSGRTSMFMFIPNAKLRDRVAQLAGVTVTGSRANLVLA